MHPEFERAYKHESEVDPYYKRKYEYMKDHGFFSKMESVQFGTINESVIKDCMSQLPQIVFETTDFCNLNCTYCSLGDFYERFDARNQKKINFNHAVTLLKYIFELRQKSPKNQLWISFHGGEPLFNGSFIKQIVSVVKQMNVDKGIEVVYSMTTNATMLHKYIHFLMENEFRLLISLDGNELNHSYRSFKRNGENSFSKVVENVDMIQREYPTYFAKHVHFNAVLHDRNSIKDIYEFIYARYHKIPRIAELTPCDVSPDKEDLFNSMFQSKRKSESEYVKEEYSFLPHEELTQYKELINFLKYYSINSFVSNVINIVPVEKRHVPTSTCIPFWKKLMLTADSKLTLCEKVSHHKLALGEVDNKVKINFQEIVNQYNSYYKQFKEKCQNCYVNKFCEVCLFMIKDNNIDEVNSEKFVCEGFHSQKAFQNKLFRLFSFLEKHPEDNKSIIENVIIV